MVRAPMSHDDIMDVQFLTVGRIARCVISGSRRSFSVASSLLNSFQSGMRTSVESPPTANWTL